MYHYSLPLYMSQQSCLPLEARRRLVASAVMSVFEYADVIYMHASAVLRYVRYNLHGALRFITNLKALTHRWTSRARVSCSALSYHHRLTHCYIIIYKAVLASLPAWSLRLIKKVCKVIFLQSQDSFLLSVPNVCTELGKIALKFAPAGIGCKIKSNLRI